MALSDRSSLSSNSDAKTDNATTDATESITAFSQIEHVKTRINRFEKQLFELSEHFDQQITLLKAQNEISPHSLQEIKEEDFSRIDLEKPKAALEIIITNYKEAIDPWVEQMIALTIPLSDDPSSDTCLEACNAVLPAINLLLTLLNKSYIVLSCQHFSEPTLLSMTQNWVSNLNLNNLSLPQDRILFNSIQPAITSLFAIINHALRNIEKIDKKINDHLSQIHSNSSSLSNSQQLSASTSTLGEQTRQVSPMFVNRVLTRVNTAPLQRERSTPPNTPIPINGYDPSFLSTPRSRAGHSRSQNSLSSTESVSTHGSDSDRSHNKL